MSEKEPKRRYLFLILVIIVVVVTVWKVRKNYSNKITSVPVELKEVSGLEYDAEGRLWAINDGGNAPELYRLDSLGRIDKTVRVSNAKNVDWEDMTQDYFGHFFIGDFGNNKNERTDLTIYKIENAYDYVGPEAFAEIIKFKFGDQDLENVSDTVRNFDLEAFLFYEGRLYLFTKNRTKPFDGYTNLYRMEDYASNQKAEFISRYKTCRAGRFQCWVTSAALSPDRKRIALLGSSKIWIFSDWEGDDFFTGKLKEIDLGMMTQKEALTFANDSTLMVADEKFLWFGGNLYTVSIPAD